eukprot:gene15927-22060_t
MLVLLIGDLHIPHRASDLPKQFKELLKPGKIHSIICCGNLCSKVFLEYLRSICSNVQIVQGDFDEFSSPEQKILKLGNFKVGVCHGHQVLPWGDPDSLSLLQRQMDVDILVTGHTHEHKIVKNGDRLQINPGSATGAYHSMKHDVRPSFVLMDVDGSKANLYVYQLVADKVQVEKIDFQLKQPAQAAPEATGAAPEATTAVS